MPVQRLVSPCLHRLVLNTLLSMFKSMGSIFVRLRYLLLTSISVLVLVACGDSEQSTAVKSTLTIALDDAPISLDPVRSSTLYSEFIVVNAYDTLFRYKYLARPYELTTNLAESMPHISADGLVYTIRIKQGVHFVDDPAFAQQRGRELTADDVVFSIKRHFDPASKSQGAWLWRDRISGLDDWKTAGSNYLQPVGGLKALDRYTLQIKLNRPYPQILHTLAMGFAAIVPPEAVRYYGDRLATHTVGSGPYQVTEFNSTTAVLQRNPTFRKEMVDPEAEGMGEHISGDYDLSTITGQVIPMLDQIRIDFVSEPMPRWASFLKDSEIKLASIPSQMFSQVLAQTTPALIVAPSFNKKYQVLLEPSSSILHYDFNMLDPDFGRHENVDQDARNTALRCAIKHAVNLDEQNEKLYAGLASVYTGLILPSMKTFMQSPMDSKGSFDPELSRKLLSEAGWDADNLPVLDFGTTSSVHSRQTFELFKSWLMDIDYPSDKIRLKMYPSVGAFYKAISESKLNFWFTGWTLDYPDAENILQLFYGPNASPGSNSSNYLNEHYDNLFESARIMLPSQERSDLYQQMNTLLKDDCVTIAGLSSAHLHAWHRDVIAYPNRDIVGGFALRFYGVKP